MIADSIQIILFFGLIAALTNWFALRRGYFSYKPWPAVPIRLRQVAGCFAIYLGLMFLGAPLIGQMLYSLSGPSSPSLDILNLVQIVILAGTITLLVSFSLSQGRDVFFKTIKDPSAPGSDPVVWDIALGILTWTISFPVVVVIGQIGDLLIYIIYQFENYEQVAVRYLKSTTESPSQLAIALGMIVLIAPCIEEFLFRACLQNFIKKKLGFKAALLVSSLCFSLFHYSSTQGLGNVSLISSLFVFALFLGFLYERQKSLFASIALHMTFNFASSVRILFLPDS